MSRSRILLDSVLETGNSLVYPSSQSGGFCLPINKDLWYGSAKLYPSGTYKGPTSLNAQIKVTGVCGYDGTSLPGIKAIPTKAIFGASNSGSGTAIFYGIEADPTFLYGGMKITLTRDSGGKWDGVMVHSGYGTLSWNNFDDSDTFALSGVETGAGWVITGDWVEGDTITCYYYQIRIKVSSDGGATWGSNTSLWTDPASSHDFTYAVSSGLSVRFLCENTTAPAVNNDILRVTAGYNYGVDQLYNASRLKRWIANRVGTQAIMIDNATNDTVDMLSVLDAVGTVTMQQSTNANLINTCHGTINTISGTDVTLTHSGTWSNAINGGVLYITTGTAMGLYRTISTAPSTDTITIASGITGAAAGDGYMIVPTTANASAVTFTSDAVDYHKFFVSLTSRAFWITFAAGTSRASCSILRLGAAITPTLPPDFSMEQSKELGSDTRRTAVGDMQTRAVGYNSDLETIIYDRILKTDRDLITAAIDATTNLNYSRFPIIIPYIGDADVFLYGPIESLEHGDEGKVFAALSMTIRKLPTE
jgi:hypothetical protein